MGVRDTHTKYELETQRGRPGGASQVPDLNFEICNLGPKSSFFLPKTALEPAKNGQT